MNDCVFLMIYPMLFRIFLLYFLDFSIFALYLVRFNSLGRRFNMAFGL